MGGKLTVTTERLVFSPNRIEKLLGACKLEIQRDDLRSVDLATGWFRLIVVAPANDRFLFRVNDPEHQLLELRSMFPRGQYPEIRDAE